MSTTPEERQDYDDARTEYTAAIHPILLDPDKSKYATLIALIDCVACISAGAVYGGGLAQVELVERFKQSLAEAVQVAGEKDGAH